MSFSRLTLTFKENWKVQEIERKRSELKILDLECLILKMGYTKVIWFL